MGLLLLVERALLLELAALARRAALDLGEHGLLFGQVELGGRDGPCASITLRDVLPDVHGAVAVPTFGAIPRIGSVPHAWAVPTGSMPPFVLDISSSVVAANKIQLLRRTGAPLLPGLMAEENGTPIMDERPVPEGVRLLPWGSTRELGSHKGYGMAVIGQVFSGILSAGLFGITNPPGNGSQFVAAYSIDAFRDIADFKNSMDEFLTFLTETPPAPGHDRVYYAGLPEHEETQIRLRDGIPLHREVTEWFDSATDDLGLDPLIRQ